jgi:hypothetical protein
MVRLSRCSLVTSVVKDRDDELCWLLLVVIDVLISVRALGSNITLGVDITRSCQKLSLSKVPAQKSHANLLDACTIYACFGLCCHIVCTCSIRARVLGTSLFAETRQPFLAILPTCTCAIQCGRGAEPLK